MAQKTCQTPCDPQAEIGADYAVGTDYALIATGVSAALIALIYLILI